MQLTRSHEHDASLERVIDMLGDAGWFELNDRWLVDHPA